MNFNQFATQVAFFDEIQLLYNDAEIFQSFLNVFSYLPIGALIQKKVLCIHGGLSSNFMSIDQIKSIKKPIIDFDNNPILSGVLWSDPSSYVRNFIPNLRGTGQFFGEDQLNNFLRANFLQLIVRGHQCADNGIEMMFENKLITVFSASNYCGYRNRSGVLIVNENGQIGKETFPSFERLTRTMSNVDFRTTNNFLMTKIISVPIYKRKVTKSRSFFPRKFPMIISENYSSYLSFYGIKNALM